MGPERLVELFLKLRDSALDVDFVAVDLGVGEEHSLN